jgi:ribosome-associated translation inhibitor RaiA
MGISVVGLHTMPSTPQVDASGLIQIKWAGISRRLDAGQADVVRDPYDRTMSDQVQITVRGFEQSEALEARIRRLLARLECRHAAILGCRVVVEAPHRAKHQGVQFVVRLDLKVPGGEIIVNRDHHEDPHVALRDAFNAAGRQLADLARRRRDTARSRGSRAKAPAPPSDE